MVFSTKFLPVPTYFQSFKGKIKGLSSNNKLNWVAREDAFDHLLEQLYLSNLSEPEKIDWLEWCSSLPCWMDPSMTTGRQILDAISANEIANDDFRIEESLKSAAGVPSENDLEDAYNWVDSTPFDGSEKQVKWAKDIAHKHHHAICLAWKKGEKIPTKAKWWIENRNNIVVSLPL